MMNKLNLIYRIAIVGAALAFLGLVGSLVANALGIKILAAAGICVMVGSIISMGIVSWVYLVICYVKILKAKNKR